MSTANNEEDSFLAKALNSLDLDDWRLKTAFITVGFSSIFGGIMFGMRQASGKDPKAYQEAFKHQQVQKFARKAFYKGSLYAVGGCSLLFTSIWLSLGCPTPKEFGKMMQETLPNPNKARLNEWQIQNNFLRDISRKGKDVPLSEEEHLPEWLKNETINKEDNEHENQSKD
jgi:hypothetical protein